MLTLSCAQVRKIDTVAINDFHIPGIVLMENAGRGAAQRLVAAGADGPVVILCGKGNNGGDGLVVARHLEIKGIKAIVVCLAACDEYRGDAAINYQIAAASGLEIQHDVSSDTLSNLVPSPAWVVDGLLGTGSSGTPRGSYAEAIHWANAQSCRKLALDIPSGLGGDDGVAHDPTFIADITCTFVAAKPGLVAANAHQFVGELHVIDIGVPRKLLDMFA